MRIKTIVCLGSLLAVSLCETRAASTLTAWTFDNVAVGTSANPQSSTGFGSASALGLSNSYNDTNSLSNPDVLLLSGSSSGGANAWRIRGASAAPNGGIGWSTNAPIGTQGAKFTGSTAGYYRVMVSFDVYATPDAEANLQVQYTTEGTIWYNATNLISSGSAVVKANSDPTLGTVLGAYVTLANGWNNGITADLSGIPGVDNNPNFAVRLVNASTGTNCVDTTGGIYNNMSGNWAVDNLVIRGTTLDTITEWTFDSYGVNGFVPHPVPEFTVASTNFAQALGFDTTFTFADGSVGSTNAPDTASQTGSSTGTRGPICWRVRGQGPGNGWFRQSGIGTQGAEFDVNTMNYSNVVLNFDLYFTSQAEAKMCVYYTTNGWTNSWVAPNLGYGPNPTFIQTNLPSNLDYSPDTVSGFYFYETTGQSFYNNLIVDFTGVPGVDNNPLFGVRVVNAAQNNDCVAYNGGSYNNSSGNCRFDNVTISGQFSGAVPPALTYDASATVDGPFTNTFVDDPAWRSAITAVYVDGALLTNSAFTTNIAGQMIFTPANSTLLQASGVRSIVVYAAGYSSAKVTQPVAAGAPKKLATIVQPQAPSASGGTLAVNPALAVTDQYGNYTTNQYPNLVVTAAVGGSGGWTLGGDLVQPSLGGVVWFTNLTAKVNGSSAVAGAVIAFTVTGYTNSATLGTTTNINSSSFNIGIGPVPFTAGNLAVFQVDTLSNNTTFSMIEVKPSVTGQKTPVNISPVNATGTNALRESPSGSTGRLAISDDGTLLVFAAFADDSSATPDETLNLDRAVGTVNYTNQLSIPMTYVSTSLGGSQARSACTLDEMSWLADDKGGLYYGSGDVGGPNVNSLNNVVVKTFGHVPYVETQKTANGSPIPVIYALNPSDPTIAIPNNLGTDPVAGDFYMVSTNGGSTYDILYISEQVSSSEGVIRKYSWVSGADPINGYGWAANDAFTNATGIDGLFAATNGSGGVYLFYTTGAGGTGGNSIIRVADANGWNQPINIVSSNLIYTAAKTVSLKGLTFTPQPTPGAAEPTPPPVLVAHTGANVVSSFAIGCVPDDPAWRAAITTITVNGSVLPPAAYDKTQAGSLVFSPAQSALLQTTGSKSIVITATGYGTNFVTQPLTFGPASQLVVTTQPTAPAGDGGPLAHQPVVKAEDLYGNVVTNAAGITAAAVQSTWTLGGTATVTPTLGVATYAGLTAFSTNAVTGATISFSLGGLTATSTAFNIPAPLRSTLGTTRIAGGNFAFSFTNITGLSYSVLATNNISAPVSTWPVVGAAIESPAGSGIYQFTNTPPTNSQVFYILRQP